MRNQYKNAKYWTRKTRLLVWGGLIALAVYHYLAFSTDITGSEIQHNMHRSMNDLREQCQEEDLAVTLGGRLPLSTSAPRCDHIFLDFGSNVGDSLTKFIDGGFDVSCGNLRFTKEGRFEKVSLNTIASLTNRLSVFTRQNLRSKPEDYCVIGLEGNPRFTKTLQKLQRDVMSMSPRPVKYVKFMTETIATSKEGPTELFLDTVNEGASFWGSSIYKDHSDVQRSAQREGKTPSARVQGVTMTGILKKYQPSKHLMIKMDIEGAEFVVLRDAYESGVLCSLVKKGVAVDMLVEVHPMTGSTEAAKDKEIFTNQVMPGLMKCGVKIKIGQAG